MADKTYDLEDRLIEFASSVIQFGKFVDNGYAGVHLNKQLTRSGTSPALNYGEAQASELRRDFIHKMKVCLKELRETKICLLIIKRSGLAKNQEPLGELLDESSQLIAIFTASILTA